jgi:hypothetical protein
LQKQVAALQKTVTTLQANKALELAPFVTVDANPENGVRGPHITFTGANIHIVDGGWQTKSGTGLGNLIIGYNEILPGQPFVAGYRGGSHSIVVGPYHKFASGGSSNVLVGESNEADSYGQLVAGSDNIATYQAADSSILGGSYNSVQWFGSVVVGGETNGTFAEFSTVVGGYNNKESGAYSVIIGQSSHVDSLEYNVTQ